MQPSKADEITARRKRKTKQPMMADYGPVERLARGDVFVEGDAPYRRGRAFDVVLTFPQAEREAAAWLDHLSETAAWSGFQCSSTDRGNGGSRGVQTERAEDARKMLWRVEHAIGPVHWLVIFHVLFFMEPQDLFAKRVRIRKSDVRTRLRAALEAVADYRRRNY